MNARITEETISLSDVATESSTDPISLDGASKFSIQVVATTGDSIAHLEASNDEINWTEIDSATIAEGASDMFEEANSDFRWVRITLENNDMVNVSADCLVLVIGDAE